MSCAKKVFDTPDLLRHIYSFGDPGHRKFTDLLSVDLPCYPELLVERYRETSLSGVVSYCMNDYLFEFSTIKLKRLLKTYKRCFCCMRHSNDKPHLDPWKGGKHGSIGV